MGMEPEAELTREVGMELKKSSEHEWHFFDDDGSWIPYGKPNSPGKLPCTTTTTSDDIEKQYIANHDRRSCVFRSKDHQYLFDFENMIQINLITHVKKPIRRVHIKNNSQCSSGLHHPKKFSFLVCLT